MYTRVAGIFDFWVSQSWLIDLKTYYVQSPKLLCTEEEAESKMSQIIA